MKRVAILFISSRWDDSYSLTSVVKSQIRTLAVRQYPLKVLNTVGCPPWKFRSKVQYHSCVPAFPFDFNTTEYSEAFYKKIDAAVEQMAPYFADVDIVLAHDVIFIWQFLPYNLIIRKIAERYPHVKWFHWCHSGPGGPYQQHAYPRSLVNTAMAKSKIVTVAQSHRRGFAKAYTVPLKDVLVVPNPRVTQDFLNFHPLTWKIIQQADLLSADVVNVMATTISRDAKQPEICLFILAAMKKEGRSVRQVFINSFAHQNFKEEANILHLEWLAKRLGLTEKEVIFTSRVDKRLTKGCPPIMTRDLFLLSNIFIHPSIGEACSLTLLEAAITKHLCVLNSNLKSFRALTGGGAIWVKFDNITNVMLKYMEKTGDEPGLNRFFTYYKDNEKLYRRLARRIIAALDRDPSQTAFSWVKSRFNEDAVYERYLKKIVD